MYNEGTPAFAVDQGMYYPTATNYGYYCTGLESPSEWENHHVIFGVDGSDVQFAGVQIENSPYLCFMPSLGYTQSPYNPYNPYIPGAIIGVEGPFAGSQQYCTYSPCQNLASSPAYIPFVVQPDIGSNGPCIANEPAAKVSKNKLGSASTVFPRNPPKIATYQRSSLSRNPEGPRANTGQSKQNSLQGGITPVGCAAPTSVCGFQGGTASVSVPPADSVSVRASSDFGSNYYTANNKLRPKFYVGRSVNDVNGSSADTLGEQNRGPRTKRPKSQLVVKAYTTKAGDTDAEGNIVINPDQYNKDDLQIDYVGAKFLVIKSYSEDDVHKSIKYNVWSSTPHGNKKLHNAYEDAKRVSEKSGGCPIFLFFSVNASGLFCGVAEMVGPVDFHRDMDFWQQDKWSGCFPVKWHIIKDVPNSCFRHITLENNENKPVTNSRDTQEVMRKQGLEMLKIFKDHTAKTSLLDDFMYYENRQRIVQDEKAQLLYKTLQNSFQVPELDYAKKLNFPAKLPLSREKTISKPGVLNCVKTPITTLDDNVLVSSDIKGSNNTSRSLTQIPDEAKEDITSALKIGSLTLNQVEVKPVANTMLGDVVTVGSMAIKVNGHAVFSPEVSTAGSILLDSPSLPK